MKNTDLKELFLKFAQKEWSAENVFTCFEFILILILGVSMVRY
jgi:hypothetical protein